MQARPATLAAGSGAAGYQPTMRVDFSTAFVPSGRTLREEMEALRLQSAEHAAPTSRGKRSKRMTRQPKAKDPDARQPWVMRHKKLTAATGAFAVMALIFAIYIAPVLIAGTRAYRDVFVESEGRPTAPAIAIVNQQQTPVTASQANNDPLPTPTPQPEWTGTEPLTMLLLGVDRREDETARSDTIILVNIDPATESAAILSIPRDTKVIIPGFGIQKINAAYAYGDYNKETIPGGGPGLVMQTIEANFGIHVDYFAEVDFNGFQTIIDTVGGITIDNPYPIKDDEYPADGNNYQRIYFPAGWQHLNGERALIYARTRHDDGDARRNERQQQVLLALREQAMNLDLISKAPELLTELANTFRTDLSFSQAVELARLGARIDDASITQYSLMPALTEEQLPNQPYYLVPDWNAVAAILTDFAGETIAPPASALANPIFTTPVIVRNSSGIEGMASRVADMLQEHGFINVTVDPTFTGEYLDATQIVDRAGSLVTSMYLAGAIGVSIDSIQMEGVDELYFEDFDWRVTGAISINIGADAPDPMYYDAETALQDTFDSLGVEVETREPETGPTPTPPMNYVLPATGDPSSDGGEQHAQPGDLTGGPDEGPDEPAPSPTEAPS
jgi:LCP family protein required for cell wall assembly